MSPYRAKARLLGIGVADIARTCGAICISPFSVSPKAAEPVPDVDAQLNCKFCPYNQIIILTLSEEILVFTATLFSKNAARLYIICERMVGDPA